MTVTLVDAEAAVRDWVNANAALVSRTDPTVPLPFGAQLGRLSAIHKTYLYLLLVGNTTGLTAEAPVQVARISGMVYGGTKQLAERGARAYANQLWALVNGGSFPTAMGAATCLLVDGITGPLPLDEYETSHEQYRYLVDADFYLTG